jgi:pilus assembly protein CpaE
VNGGPVGPLSVVLIDRDKTQRGSIKSSLGQIGHRVVGEAENLASGLSLVHGLQPDILILDLPPNPDAVLETLKGLRGEIPEMGIIATAHDSSTSLVLKTIRAGAQEFLTRPVEHRELVEAVKRLSSMVRRTVGPKKKAGKIVTVFSSKGGVGVTSIATNLAVSLAKNAKRNTVIVDLNLQMGDAGLLLDLRPAYTTKDAVGGNLDEARLKGLLARHESGVYLLSTPEHPVDVEKITPGLLLEIISLLRGMFDFIVVDAGHGFDGRVLEVVTLADLILVMAVLDVPTVRNAKRCISLFHELGYTGEKVKLVVNRYQKSKVTLSDIEEATDTKVYWQIPNDYKTLIASIDAGVPAVIQSPRSKMSRAIEDLGKELCRLQEGGGSDAVVADADHDEPNDAIQQSR